MCSATTPGGHVSPRDRYVLAAIVCLAVVLRAGVCWWRADQLTIDRDAYLGLAENLAAGTGFCTPGTTNPTAYRPPLYPLLLATTLPWLGMAASVAAWNILAGAATVVCVDRVGEALRLGRWRHFASLLVAGNPLLLYASTQPMTEVVFTALTTAWLWGVSASPTSERTAQRSVMIGVLFGLAALCRPTIWPLAGLMAMSAAIHRERRIGAAGWTVLGALLVVSPWVVRNAVVMGRPIVTTTHGGYTLLLANNPVYFDEVVSRPWGTTWGGESLARWQGEVERRVERDVGRQGTEIERDAWMSAEGRRFIVAEPGKFLRSAVHRVRSLWSVMPKGEGAVLPMAVRVAAGGWSIAVYVLAGMGLWRVGRRGEWRNWLPALLLVVTIQGVHLAYWTDTRMRSPLEPVLALGAARGLAGRGEKRSVGL